MARNERTHIVNDDTKQSADSAFVPRNLSKEEFGRRLYQLMIKQGLRQSDLARKAGVQRDSISVYVRGKSLPTALNLSKIATALGVTAEDLLPNHAIAATAADAPDFELRVSPADPRTAWVRLNRLVSLETAIKIASLVEADAANRS